jgi:hypothetical protein
VLCGELLGLTVVDVDDRQIGTVTDVRLAGPARKHGVGPTELLGFVISPHTRSSYLDYERTNANAPALLSGLFRWRHRGTFLAGWEDIARFDDHSITLRVGYHRYSARLDSHH